MFSGYQYDEPAGLYSLGVILYESLFNELAFNQVELEMAVRAYSTRYNAVCCNTIAAPIPSFKYLASVTLSHGN